MEMTQLVERDEEKKASNTKGGKIKK